MTGRTVTNTFSCFGNHCVQRVFTGVFRNMFSQKFICQEAALVVSSNHLRNMVLGKNNPISSYQPSSLGHPVKVKTERTEQKLRYGTLLATGRVPPCAYPAPPGLRVRRRSAVSPNVVSRSASTLSQVRPGTGRTRHAHDVKRHWPAAVAPCRGPTTVLPLLFLSPHPRVLTLCLYFCLPICRRVQDRRSG